MAIDGTVQGQHANLIGISQESTFGTPIADNGTFIQFEADIPQPDYGLFKDRSMKNTGSRVIESANIYTTEKGGIRTIAIPNIIPRRTDLAELLYAVFQNVTEGASTPYTKTFTWDGSGGTPTTQPVFADNGGYFATIGIDQSIDGAYDHKFTSCICKTLELSCDIADDGRLKANAEFISGFSSAVGSEFSGTWAFETQNYFEFNAMSTKQLNSNDLVIYNFSLNLNNNAVRVGADSSGDAESYAIGNPNYSVTGSITVKWDSNTYALFTDYLAGTQRQLQLATGSAGAAGHLDFTMPEIDYDNPTQDYGRPEGQAVTIPFEAVHDGTNPIITVTLSDEKDQTW